MTTNSNEGKDWEQNEENEKFNFQPKPLSDEPELTENKDKEALARMEKLSQLSFRLIYPSIDWTTQIKDSFQKFFITNRNYYLKRKTVYLMAEFLLLKTDQHKIIPMTIFYFIQINFQIKV